MMQAKSAQNNALKRIYSDEELVALFVETKNNLYFGLLYERYVGNVQRRCMNIIKDLARAEDVTQDIFLKLISRLDSFRNSCRFESWLNVIAYNYCVDEMRSSKQRREITIHEGLEALEEKSIDGEYDEVAHLKKIMIFLTKDERELLDLRYSHDLSVREIANVLEISESATKMRLLRTRARLRKNFDWQNT